MDISRQISFNKVILNLNSPLEGGLQLNPGELVKGSVQEVKQNGLLMLMIRGKLIEAATEVMVKPGQELYLMVDEFKNGTTYLKVVNSQVMGQIESAKLSQSLLDIGITAREDNVQMARKLIQYNMAINQDNLNSLNRSVSVLGGMDAKNLEIAAFCLSKGISQPESLLALSSYLGADDKNHQLLPLLKYLIQSLDNQQGAKAAVASSGAESLVRSTEGEKSVLERYSPRDDGTKVQKGSKEFNTRTDQVKARDLLARAGSAQSLNIEDHSSRASLGKFDSLQVNEDKKLNNTASAFSKVDTAIVKDENFQNRLLTLLRTVVELIEIKPEEGVGKTAERMQSSSRSERDILKTLLLLEDMADDEKTAEKIPALKEIASRLASSEKEYLGQRLINLPDKMAADNSAYYFSFPVKIDKSYSLCRLKINKEGRTSFKDMDKLSLVVSLDTPKLGLVLFHVNWKKKGEVKLQGVVDNEGAADYLDDNINVLVNNLQKLGLQVINQGIRVSQDKQELNSSKAHFEDVKYSFKPIGIDMKV